MMSLGVEVAEPPPFVAELMVTDDVDTTTESAVPVPETTMEQVFALPAVPPVFHQRRSWELLDPIVRDARTAVVPESPLPLRSTHPAPELAPVVTRPRLDHPL